MRGFKKILLSLSLLILIAISGLLIVVKTKTHQASANAENISHESKSLDHSLYFKTERKNDFLSEGTLVEEEAYASLAVSLSQKAKSRLPKRHHLCND
ncbi:hypothetical protein [Streptococcus pluranimalium]|uniref:hypothetical protein n=1 Tax=Streptococcus pluranimalium TaxID=82348 RepID=UPI0031392CD0